MDPIIIVLIIVIIIILIYSYPTSHENFTNDEAIQNVASLYNSGMATVTNLNATGVATLPNLNAGNININGDVVTGKARMHLTGPELLYLLNKNGVIIGKEWDGNRSIFGGNGGCEDDYTFTCQNGKLARVRNHCNAWVM